MKKFKAGDIVTCISTSHPLGGNLPRFYHITINKNYEVSAIGKDDSNIIIDNDVGYKTCYPVSNFKLSQRDNKAYISDINIKLPLKIYG